MSNETLRKCYVHLNGSRLLLLHPTANNEHLRVLAEEQLASLTPRLDTPLNLDSYDKPIDQEALR